MTVRARTAAWTGGSMAYDKQLDLKFRLFSNRILELEKAADAQDRALRQLAEKAGIEVDLTWEEHGGRSVRSPREESEVLALLEEAQRDEPE